METLFTWLIVGGILGFFLIRYWRAHKHSETKSRESAERGALYSDGPKAQHPKILETIASVAVHAWRFARKAMYSDLLTGRRLLSMATSASAMGFVLRSVRLARSSW